METVVDLGQRSVAWRKNNQIHNLTAMALGAGGHSLEFVDTRTLICPLYELPDIYRPTQ